MLVFCGIVKVSNIMITMGCKLCYLRLKIPVLFICVSVYLQNHALSFNSSTFFIYFCLPIFLRCHFFFPSRNSSYKTQFDSLSKLRIILQNAYIFTRIFPQEKERQDSRYWKKYLGLLVIRYCKIYIVTHTRIYLYILYIYMYIYMRVCVCAYVTGQNYRTSEERCSC
jgi:hypothetical protein